MSVLYLGAIVSGKLIELASSTIGQRAKRVLGHRAKLGQRAKSRQRSGYKAIKETEKPFKTEFNQSKAKTNDNCSKLSPRDPHHTRVNSTSASEPTLSPPASKKQSKQYLPYFHQNFIWHFDYSTTKKWRAQTWLCVWPRSIYNNYSMSLSWIWSDKITNERVAWVGYSHFISSKGEWNNCFSKLSNRVLPPIFISTIIEGWSWKLLAENF